MNRILVLALLAIATPAAAQPVVTLPEAPVFRHPKFFTGVDLTYYVSASGSDTDDCSAATPCATPQHVLTLLPTDFNNQVFINVGPGTYGTAGANTLTLPAVPGVSSTGVYGTVSLRATCSVPDKTWASTGAGSAVVSGTSVTKTSQKTFNIGSYSATVTDGSHFRTTSQTLTTTTSSPVLASTTPNMVTLAAATTALTAGFLCPYDTIFQGTSWSISSNLSAQAAQSLKIMGIRFPGAVSATNVNFYGARIATGVTLTNSTIAGCFVSGGRVLLNQSNSSLVSLDVFSAVSLTAFGPFRFSVVTFKGAPVDSAHVRLGAQNTSIATFSGGSMPASGVGFAQVDIEGTGDGVMLGGGDTGGVASSGVMSFDMSAGRAFDLEMGAKFRNLGTISGKQALPSRLKSGSYFYGGETGYTVANSANAGQDWLVGALSVDTIANQPTTDPTELCRVE